MSRPIDPGKKPVHPNSQESLIRYSQQPVDPASQPPPAAGHGPVANSANDREPLSQLFGGMLLGLAVLVLGGLGYLLAITILHPPRSMDLPWLNAPLNNTGTNANAVPSPAALPLEADHNKSTSLRTLGDQRSQSMSVACLSGSQPEMQTPADPSNYGTRQATDWKGRPVANKPALIVLHETVVDESTALALFRSPHSSDAQQASYHVLIGRDGRRMRLVPDSERAYGAGDSDFEGMAVQLKPRLRPSLNNIALHVSLVSPPDGADGDRLRHSGYTNAQYRSLAAQIAQWKVLYGIESSSVVTHQEVDRSGSRRDPRSFNWNQLGQGLRSLWLACGGSPLNADLERSGVQTQGR